MRDLLGSFAGAVFGLWFGQEEGLFGGLQFGQDFQHADFNDVGGVADLAGGVRVQPLGEFLVETNAVLLASHSAAACSEGFGMVSNRMLIIF